MSNLSELLPTGGGQNSVDFVASGTLASGQAVALKTDGTVETIASVAQGVGAESVFEAATSNYARAIYDSNSNKVVIVYVDAGNSAAGTAIVGTVSGTSISFGTPATFGAAGVTDLFVTFDSTANKVVISYNLSGTGKSVVGTVSGTSISFGTAVVFNSASANYISSTFDSTNNKIVIGYRDLGNSNYGTAIVGTVSGTSISFGTEVVFETADTRNTVATFDSSNNKVVFAYGDAGNSQYGTAIVGTVSGTSISFGTAVVFESATVGNTTATFDSTANKVVIGYDDAGNSYSGTAIVGTVSGTAISFGTAVVLNTGGTSYTASTFDSNAGKVVIAYTDQPNSSHGTAIAGTVSGTSISFGDETVYNAAVTYYNAATYDSTNNKVVFAYRDEGNSQYGTAVVFTVASSNNTSFIGITDEAIANTASGSVIVQGGIITNSSLVPNVPAVSAGSVGLTSDSGQHMGAAYDANANRVVAAYRDNNNSYYGTAAVGTVSGTSISFGTPVVFKSANTTYSKVAYDATNQLTFIAYNTGGAAGPSAGQYGAVSGTTINFGSYSPVSFNNDASFDLAVAHDLNAGKMVVAYYDYGNSGKGTAVVGSLSGTTLSFGTEVVYNNAGTSRKNSMAYDANAQKVVISHSNAGNSDYPTSIVGTVSGTAISFGSETVIANVSSTDGTATVYDSGNQKIIVSYVDVSNSKVGKAVVGTVSGTSIAFGTPVAFAESLAISGWLSSAYDSNNGVVVFNFKNNSGNAGTCLPAVVDGTSFSYGPSVVFESGSTEYTSTVYDTTAQKFVVVYNDGGGGDAGSAVVLSPSVTTGLTIASDYYVQTDGSLSTTTSTVKAGQAVSATTINMKDLT